MDQALTASGYSDDEIEFAMVRCGCGGLSDATRLIDGERASGGSTLEEPGPARPPAAYHRPSIETLADSIRKIKRSLEAADQSTITEADEARTRATSSGTAWASHSR